LMRGMHPLVPTPEPNPRPFSEKNEKLESDRAPSRDTKIDP
jgi:hypothetical protein